MSLKSYVIFTCPCRPILRLFINGCKLTNNLPFLVLDAFGKLPSGVVQGDFQWIGSYDECNSIRHSPMSHRSGNHSRTIEGKYCMLAVGTVQAVRCIL